jgi:hypothetical protein
MSATAAEHAAPLPSRRTRKKSPQHQGRGVGSARGEKAAANRERLLDALGAQHLSERQAALPKERSHRIAKTAVAAHGRIQYIHHNQSPPWL